MKLDVASGTGPDALPALILKRGAPELALPIAVSSWLCLGCGRLPICWRRHWIHTLHKRNATSDPCNYKGVHLTAQLATVVGRQLDGFLYSGLASPDLASTSTRIRATRLIETSLQSTSALCYFQDGFAVGLYCSDVSGPLNTFAARVCARSCV